MDPRIIRPLARVVLVGLGLALTSCATTRPMRVEAPPKTPEVGVASYYSGRWHGRRTASGERFDMHEMTAAHRTLPFGTRVRVTNLANGHEAVVRINDRGPWKKKRVIDVSYAAARKLGMIGSGTARVRVDVLAAQQP
jgi:rare lipoprotein A